MFRVFCSLVIAGVLAVLAGCQGQGSGTGNEKSRLYDIKGKVVAVDAGKKTVTLDHEDIPGLMKAMQMEFGVADEKLLAVVKPGDAVHGKLKAEGGSYVVTSLEKH